MLEIAVPATVALLIEVRFGWRECGVETPLQRAPAVFESGL
jgi:hypothetical protein